jgi:hypothetical protein
MLRTGRTYSREEVWNAYQVAYRGKPEWLNAIAHYFQ